MSERRSTDTPRLEAYRRADQPLPARYWLWPLYGAGFENLGRDGQPIEVELREPGPDEILVRHDAVGLCFSDTKILHAGETHPRLEGRDMRASPVVMGHEVSLTVVKAGANRAAQFKPGERYIVQADIYYRGKGLAYGYALQGGFSQYNIVGPEVLDGDEGCYLLPVRPETGYAQAALTEPWACVTASYDVEYRAGWLPGGTVLVVGGPAARGDTTLGTPYAGGQPPEKVVAAGVPPALAEELAARARADGFTLLTLDATSPALLEQARAEVGPKGYTDIVFLGPDADLYAAVEPLAGQGCQLSIVGAGALTAPAPVDVGRLHYDHLSLTGTDAADLSQAYAPIRTELAPGGAALFIGAAGPMGQMHVQRALQAEEGPRRIVASDLDPERLGALERKYESLIAAKRGVSEFAGRTPEGKSPAEFNASLLEITGGAGYDDIVVLAPSARVIEGAVPMLAAGGMMDIFAGLARGTRASIDLRAVAERGVRFTGTSGSAIRDLRSMLGAAESGRLNPNLSVAAIAGLSGLKEGLEGVDSQAFPGKVVVYPQILEMPVTRLEDLERTLPRVYALLGPQHSWTVEAEAQFLEECLP